MSAERIDEIEKRLQAATPGTFIDYSDRDVCSVKTRRENVAMFYGGEKIAVANAELFIQATADIAYLIARVRELEAKID